MTTVLLADRDGHTLGPLAEKTVPALLSLRGAPILERALESLVSAGIRSALVVVGPRAVTFRAPETDALAFRLFRTGITWADRPTVERIAEEARLGTTVVWAYREKSTDAAAAPAPLVRSWLIVHTREVTAEVDARAGRPTGLRVFVAGPPSESTADSRPLPACPVYGYRHGLLWRLRAPGRRFPALDVPYPVDGVGQVRGCQVRVTARLDDVRMPEKLAYRPERNPVHHQPARERMPQRMDAEGRPEPGRIPGPVERALHVVGLPREPVRLREDTGTADAAGERLENGRERR